MKNEGSALTGLVVLLNAVALVAVMAIPRPAPIPPVSNEGRAISMLHGLVGAQAQFSLGCFVRATSS